ncbi:MAG: hypothetical protein ABUL54_02825 [Dongia sp.]
MPSKTAIVRSGRLEQHRVDAQQAATRRARTGDGVGSSQEQAAPAMIQQAIDQAEGGTIRKCAPLVTADPARAVLNSAQRATIVIHLAECSGATTRCVVISPLPSEIDAAASRGAARSHPPRAASGAGAGAETARAAFRSQALRRAGGKPRTLTGPLQNEKSTRTLRRRIQPSTSEVCLASTTQKRAPVVKVA